MFIENKGDNWDDWDNWFDDMNTQLRSLGKIKDDYMHK